MKTLSVVGLVAFLSIVGFGWTSAAPSSAAEPPSGVAEYVYLHVTRSKAVSIQEAGGANTCQGTTAGVRS